MITQSPELPKPPHPAKQAIDENSNTYAHTSVEPNAWWSMEFCNDVIIATVRLCYGFEGWSWVLIASVPYLAYFLLFWNRVDCCDEQMANFVVTVDNEICGQVDGAIGVGIGIDVTCPKPLIGTVLRIRRTDTFFLSISELHMLRKMENSHQFFLLPLQWQFGRVLQLYRNGYIFYLVKKYTIFHQHAFRGL